MPWWPPAPARWCCARLFEEQLDRTTSWRHTASSTTRMDMRRRGPHRSFRRAGPSPSAPSRHLAAARAGCEARSTSPCWPRSTAPPRAAGPDIRRTLESGGADAIELNLYDGGHRASTRAAPTVEDAPAGGGPLGGGPRERAGLREAVSPFYAALPATSCAGSRRPGRRGVVVFNRYYQPDIDLEHARRGSAPAPLHPAELPLRLHALASAHGRTSGSPWPARAASTADATPPRRSSVGRARGAAGLGAARARGPSTSIRRLTAELDGLAPREGLHCRAAEARGVLSHASTPDPQRWERLNYLKVLDGWRA
jgi:hypothetical protein